MKHSHCLFFFTVFWLIACSLYGCTPVHVNRYPPYPKQTRPQVPDSPPQRSHADRSTKITSQETASLELVHQAQRHLQARDPHSAIRTLEKALQLNPVGGQNYFYLAEAWIQLNRPHQANEYHRLATIYLPPHGSWQEKLLIQKEKIAALPTVK